MSRKRKILDILGMILGVLLVIVNGMMVGLEYMYQVGDKIYMLGTMRDKMIPLVFGVFCFLLGVFLIYRGPRDFRRYRRYQLFKSICAGREYVEIEEIAREGRCSPRFCASKHETDVEKALAYGSGSGCAGRHDSVWRRGESIVSESMESVESKTECVQSSRGISGRAGGISFGKTAGRRTAGAGRRN